MKKFILTVIISVATAMTSLAQFPSWGGAQSDFAQMQAPQIVMPQPASSVEDAPVVDFAHPVTFAWMPCTNPSGAPVRITYTLTVWRLMGLYPATAIDELEPIMVVKDLTAPQYTYFKPLSERIGYFVNGEAYALVVKATVQSLNGGAAPAVANGGDSAYSVFIVDDPEQLPPPTDLTEEAVETAE